MTNEKKLEMARYVGTKANITIKEARKAFDAVFEYIAQTNRKVHTPIGIFEWGERRGYTLRSPLANNGEKRIPRKQILKFRRSYLMKRVIADYAPVPEQNGE